MLDNKLLRNDIDTVAKNLLQRGFEFDVQKFQQLEIARKKLQTETENIQAKRNDSSKQIGLAKQRGDDVTDILAQMSDLAENLKQKEAELKQLQHEYDNFLAFIPNLLHDSVPAGTTEDDNVEVKTWGKKPSFDFTPAPHDDLGEELGGIDLKSAAKVSGSRFMVLRGNIAKLHRALTQYMLDTQISKHGYQEIYSPYLARSEILFGTGQLPKFRDDQFGIEGEDLWLIPTAEVPLTNLAREHIFKLEELPLKYVCHSPCFRREAGAYGQDTKGILRQHQFDKVELVQIVAPDKSYAALEELRSHAEFILEALELPYRVVVKCSADTGFSATKTYDLEVWVPSQNCYREISSCSNTESFQARRMQARVRIGKKTELVHTLNGSGLAVGRALIAVMENYQTADGKIKVPKVLQDYMQQEIIESV